MADSRPLRFGSRGKTAAELSDSELEAELLERRHRRARAGRHGRLAAAPLNGEEIARLFANLELPAHAGLAEVHAAYDRLVAKYEPYTMHADPDRSRAARALLGSLDRAYRGLLMHLDGVDD